MGRLRFIFNLGGGGNAQIELADGVADGQWHEVVVVRQGNTATLTLDGTQMATQSVVESHYLFLLPEDGVYHVGGVPASNASNADRGFVGCLQDPRLDGIEMPGIGEVSDYFVAVPSSSLAVTSGCNSKDVCSPNPCSLTQKCVDDWETYRCVLRNCTDSPCRNGSTCLSPGVCLCANGYTGDACEIDINECESGPCLPGEDCSDEIGHYLCSSIPFALEGEQERLEIVALVVAFVVMFILVILLVILRVWCSSRRGKGRMTRSDSDDLPTVNPYGMIEGPAMRYLRDLETRQELAGPDFEGAGEEDFDESGADRSVHSGKRWSCSTENSTFKPRPSPDIVIRRIEPRYVTAPLRFVNAVANDRSELRSTASNNVSDPARKPTASVQRRTPVPEAEEEQESPAVPVGDLPPPPPELLASRDSLRGTPASAGQTDNLQKEVEGFMTTKLAELGVSESGGIENDELCHFVEEGDMSERGSLSSLSGISDADSEPETIFWERVRTFGPQFKKLADLLAEDSVLGDTSC